MTSRGQLQVSLEIRYMLLHHPFQEKGTLFQEDKLIRKVEEFLDTFGVPCFIT